MTEQTIAEQRAAALSPQFDTCSRAIVAWETAFKKEHPEAEALLLIYAIAEPDDTKAKAWLETFEKQLDREVAREVTRRMKELSTSLVTKAEQHPAFLYHYTDELCSTLEAWIAAFKAFTTDRTLSRFEAAEKLGLQLSALYDHIQPYEVVGVDKCGDHVRVTTAPPPPKPN